MRITYMSLGLILLGISSASRTDSNLESPQRNGEPCSTPAGGVGECISIRSCVILKEKLLHERKNPAVADYLKKSLCRYEFNNPIVCCPKAVERVSSMANTLVSLIRKAPQPPQCGVPEVQVHTQKIVGGRKSTLGAWPWIAAVAYRSDKRPGPVFSCSATLISLKHLITAAHCNDVRKSLRIYMVRLGDLNLDNGVDDGASPVDMKVAKVVNHPDYNDLDKFNDIAVITLQEEAPDTKYIKPICLPTKARLQRNAFTNYYPFVAGWGATDFSTRASKDLLETQVPIVDNERCRRAFATKYAEIIPKQICAGFPMGGKDACQGDSGGPLMLPDGEVFYLIGVVSYGYKCAEPGFPGIYTRVTEYLEWIGKQMD